MVEKAKLVCNDVCLVERKEKDQRYLDSGKVWGAEFLEHDVAAPLEKRACSVLASWVLLAKNTTSSLLLQQFAGN